MAETEGPRLPKAGLVVLCPEACQVAGAILVTPAVREVRGPAIYRTLLADRVAWMLDQQAYPAIAAEEVGLRLAEAGLLPERPGGRDGLVDAVRQATGISERLEQLGLELPLRSTDGRRPQRELLEWIAGVTLDEWADSLLP